MKYILMMGKGYMIGDLACADTSRVTPKATPTAISEADANSQGDEQVQNAIAGAKRNCQAPSAIAI